jgi:hypothetical protein
MLLINKTSTGREGGRGERICLESVRPVLPKVKMSYRNSSEGLAAVFHCMVSL